MNISVADFMCKCGCTMPADAARNVPLTIERIKLIFDELVAQGIKVVSLRVISGYRCPSHNAKVDGAKASQHMLGKAADLKPVGFTVGQLYDAARAVRGDASPEHPQLGGGIGLYPNFVHVDVRDATATW